MNVKASPEKNQIVLIIIAITGILAMVSLIAVYNNYINKSDDIIIIDPQNTDQKPLIDQHFKSGIDYMLNKQYPEAVTEWENLLRLNDRIPEAHVNLGFSLLEVKKYLQACDHFNIAMDINTYQANAYYGLAVCNEKLGDLEGAMGAMRSYIHLSQPGDPFVRKARSALWEWENPLDKTFLKNQEPTGPRQQPPVTSAPTK